MHDRCALASKHLPAERSFLLRECSEPSSGEMFGSRYLLQGVNLRTLYEGSGSEDKCFDEGVRPSWFESGTGEISVWPYPFYQPSGSTVYGENLQVKSPSSFFL